MLLPEGFQQMRDFLAAAGIGWAGLSFLLAWGWAIFHILIVVLQAYIFMMLTIVYFAMAHEHH